MEDLIIETKNLRKTFVAKIKGKKEFLEAVKGINLSVKKGEIFGFLGPNGAGKSTTQKMLATLLLPTSGEAKINGYELTRQQQQIRQNIGYVSQAGGTDSMSTGLENLILQAQLYGLDDKTAKQRAVEFIERFQMGSFADRRADSYSGGQRRRLDLALGMIHHPDVLLLDEPTVGLDPQSRAYLWDEIKKLRNEGITVLLTTHYLDEADKLCDLVAIIDHGEIVAQGTPAQLKCDIGADSIVFGFTSNHLALQAQKLLAQCTRVEKNQITGNYLHLFIKDGERVLPDLLRQLDAKELEVQSIAVSKPSLDDVFLKHTGRSLREDH
ncbi:daunorubicin resistance ABC transporter ATP-binding subunit [Desulfosporosinus orientis DSM 765]|uniref:Daunorubicin resistance ABC transporter ATP-binding subunit n=1 Tax=Desulfosporosinus orientis (strain ATCC 19365 / DSM 765 / NCIMB 8382 / VKM B-1628 / Singapore I) TaxID=768706 RepID=G7WH67_DESOD|nr:ATP-binding cassette domain-containing protein [Desulfosporosinus orientis]AET69575.1 daunorubicin resistance ABC transporter ATP-binding subunit [Desulfosporosinus orientis DSM 765]